MGTTTILVTHDQGEALVVSDRVAVMNRGRLAQVADPAAIAAGGGRADPADRHLLLRGHLDRLAFPGGRTELHLVRRDALRGGAGQ